MRVKESPLEICHSALTPECSSMGCTGGSDSHHIPRPYDPRTLEPSHLLHLGGGDAREGPVGLGARPGAQ